MNQPEPVDLNHILTQVLDGKQQIVSYPGTSQYHVQDVGMPGSERTSTSACGLIALNCARTIFRLHKEANGAPADGEHDPIGLLRIVLSEQTTEEIVSISSAWASNEHLDVEDVLDIPVFKNALTLAKTPTYTRSEFSAFKQLLQDTVDTRRDANDPVAVIITRPPEIVVCLIISTSLGNFFVVFDSHPRPLHPFGSGFIVNHSLEATSRYLSKLLAVDPKLFSDPSLRWQTDLLTHFSGHILVPRQNSALDAPDGILMEASIAILRLKADQADSRRRELSHAEEKRELTKQIGDLERQLEASFNSKGKQKAPDYQTWAPPPGGPSSKQSPKFKAWKGPNRGWEDAHRNGATGGKSSYQPQGRHIHDGEPSTSNHGLLDSLSSWLTGNHTESWQSLGMDLIHGSQDHELTKALRLSQASNSDFIRKPDYSTSDRQITQDRELANALRESKITSNDLELAKALKDSKITASNSDVMKTAHYSALDRQVTEYRELAKARLEPKITPNSDVIAQPDYSALDRQMDLDDPSPSPTPPVNKQVDVDDVASSNLAMELQRLYDEEDRQIGSERSILQKNVQAELFDCGICFETFHRDNIAQFGRCRHRYCRSCLQRYISSTLQERRYPITCPECKAKKSRKPAEVDDTMFHSLGSAPKDLQIFYELQLASHSVIVNCRKCKQTMNVDRYQYQTTSMITCPLPACSYTWCKDCQQVVVPEGPKHSCDGTSELKHLVAKEGWQYCPGCQVPIQKYAGCHHMVCLAPGCNTHFCYLCGQKIIQSAGPGVQEAVKVHYLKCQMFETELEDTPDLDND